jgi:hypothetical protein
MRLRLKGINCTRKKLASGEVVTYYYAWKGGPALRGQPGTPDFIQSYNEAIAQKVKPPTGTLLSVLQQYQHSEDFRGLADSTRRSYIALIMRIEKQFGDFPLAALTGRRRRIQELATICAGSRHLGFSLDRKSIGLRSNRNRWRPDGSNRCVR